MIKIIKCLFDGIKRVLYNEYVDGKYRHKAVTKSIKSLMSVKLNNWIPAGVYPRENGGGNDKVFMDIKQTLEQFGLIGKKADVYLAALEMGSATVIEIAKKAGIKRTTCYDILQDLINEGLISETAKGKKRLFIGEDPEKIKKDLEKRHNLISEILPQLKSMHNISGVKPKIRYFEGKEGLIEAYDDALKYAGEILAFGSEDVYKILGRDWVESYIKRRIKKSIRVRAILPTSEYLEKEIFIRDQAQLRVCKALKKEKYPFSIEIDIYGHQKVALISNKEQLAVIIESSEIYNTLKQIFELCWDLLPEKKI